MRETIINFGKNNSIVGILTTAENKSSTQKGICVIFLNAGIIHRVGPNNLYVKIARNLAQYGFTSFRFDYSGLGDSENSSGNSTESIKVAEIQLAMKSVFDKSGINRFVLTGICTGAEDAFSTALLDERIVGLIPIDGIYQERASLGQIESYARRNCSIRYYKKNLFNKNRWIKVLTGKSKVLNKKNFISALYMVTFFFLKLTKKVLKLNKSQETKNKERTFSIQQWVILFNRNVKIYLIFSEGSSMIDIFNLTFSKQLKLYEKDNLLKVETIKDVDHTFTPVWSQDLVTRLICDWMKNSLN